MNSPKTEKRFFKGIFFLFLISCFLFSNNIYSEEISCHSIHIASFRDLKNANNYVNTMSKKGKFIFFVTEDVPGKGTWHRVYLGKYKDRETAVECWNDLKEQGLVSYFGIREFPEIDIPDEDPILEDIDAGSTDDSLIMDVERFVDNQDGTVTDNKTSLMWVKNGWRLDFFSAAKWEEAQEKCKKFRLAGYSDWRLPTIIEWKSILDKNKEYPALIEPNPFENIISHMPYWSKTRYKPKQTSSVSRTLRAYTVLLYYGKIKQQSTNERAFIMPVRSID
ncbi:DUF1566 domain-containing protein [Thermodesulfobacteriota bacterium]